MITLINFNYALLKSFEPELSLVIISLRMMRMSGLFADEVETLLIVADDDGNDVLIFILLIHLPSSFLNCHFY